MVGIKSITASNTLTSNVNILSQGIVALVDTALPFIWLPLPACQIFEQAFGLIWNDDKALYLINDTSHQQLLSNNPSVTFNIGNLATDSSLNITLPYSAFDLQASNPTFQNGTNYFPLRRATSASQYTLGRTFLQEAFVFVDYEQSKFSVSPAQFPSNPSPNLVTVNHSPPPSAAPTPIPNKHHISHGAIAGIVIGVSVLFVLLCTLAYFFFRRRRQLRRQHETSTDATSPVGGKESWPSSPTNSPDPVHTTTQTDSPLSGNNRSDNVTSPKISEKPPSFVGELEDPMTAVDPPNISWPISRPRQELYGSDLAKELPPTPSQRPTHIAELAGGDSRPSKPTGKRKV